MIKIKLDKTNDELKYRMFYCKVCGKQLLRAVERDLVPYASPSIICKCSHCQSEHLIKYDQKEVHFNIINLNKNKSKSNIL